MHGRAHRTRGAFAALMRVARPDAHPGVGLGADNHKLLPEAQHECQLGNLSYPDFR